MVDVWRVLHPTDKQFPFYSASQVAYSRIEFFFVHNSDRHRLTDGQIGAREIFDHSPVYLTMHLDNKKDSLWQLNTSILNDSGTDESSTDGARTLLNLLRLLLGTGHRWCEDPIESAPFIIRDRALMVRGPY